MAINANGNGGGNGVLIANGRPLLKNNNVIDGQNGIGIGIGVGTGVTLDDDDDDDEPNFEYIPVDASPVIY